MTPLAFDREADGLRVGLRWAVSYASDKKIPNCFDFSVQNQKSIKDIENAPL
jgi:hypothetical protein